MNYTNLFKSIITLHIFKQISEINKLAKMRQNLERDINRSNIKLDYATSSRSKDSLVARRSRCKEQLDAINLIESDLRLFKVVI